MLPTESEMSSVFENAQWLELLDSTEQRVVSDVKKHIEDTLQSGKHEGIVLLTLIVAYSRQARLKICFYCRALHVHRFLFFPGFV